MVAVRCTPIMPEWPELGYNMVMAKENSQRERNVLLHGREEITAKECAVPQPGLGGAQEEPAGRKNKLHLSQGTGLRSFNRNSFLFFLSPS